jgi:hypothetical protein
MFDFSNPYLKELMVMLIINQIFQFILIRFVYYRYTKKEAYLFAFFLIGLVVFFIGCLLYYIQIEMQLAVGLVAIFTILRLRTRSITVKEMAYIFAIIGISVIDALHIVSFPLVGKLIINTIIILMALVLEQFDIRNRYKSYTIIYENVELLKPDKQAELLADLSQLTGKGIVKVRLEQVDYKKKTAEIVVFYHDRTPD